MNTDELSGTCFRYWPQVPIVTRYTTVLMRLCFVWTSVRFLVSTAMNDQFVSFLMTDHILIAFRAQGLRVLIGRLAGLMIASIVLAVMLIITWINHSETRDKRNMVKFLLDFMRGQLPPINRGHKNSLANILLINTRMFKILFWPLLISTFLSICFMSYVVYVLANEYFIWLPSIITNFMIFMKILQALVLVMIGIFTFIWVTVYLKYRFNEIDDKLRRRIRLRAQQLVTNCIEEHYFNCR